MSNYRFRSIAFLTLTASLLIACQKKGVTVTANSTTNGVLNGALDPAAQVTPVFSSVIPASSNITGNIDVSIAGSNFVSGIKVYFGTVPATNVTLVSSTQLSVRVPAAASPGKVDLTLTNPGNQTTVAAKAFTYSNGTPASSPSVTSVTPSMGPVVGGTQIAVVGSNFQPNLTALLGTVSCGAVVVQDAQHFTCVTGANSAGPQNLIVTNPDGGTIVSTGAFTYQVTSPLAPHIDSISPTAGPIAGQNVVTIFGSNFLSTATVKFDNVDGIQPSVLSTGVMTVIAPAHAVGVVDVRVTNPGNLSDVLPSAYTYMLPPPAITSVTPSSGPKAQATPITIVGTNFMGNVGVSLGLLPCQNITLVSATQITCTAPVSTTAGAVNLVVQNGDGQSANLPNGFTYMAAPAPTISSITPNSGALSGNTAVVIQGSNFVSGLNVKVDGVVMTNASFVSSTEVHFTTAAHAVGAVAVRVTNPDNQFAELAGGFTFNANPAPVLSSLDVSSGLISGGTTVTLTGSNFSDGATVKFDNLSASSVTKLSSSSLRVVTPAHAAGTVGVVVINSDQQSSNTLNAFTYVNPPPAPSISSLNIVSGPASGGTTLTISGANFSDGASVRFDTSLASGVTKLSSNALQVNTPGHYPGLVNVYVTNSDGQQSNLLANAFKYISQPSISSVSPGTGYTPGGTGVTISGSNFQSGATVTFGGVAASSVSVSASSITCVTPGHNQGTVDVTVVNPDGGSTTRGGAFTYYIPPNPTVSILSNGRAGNQADGFDVGVGISWSSTNAVGCNITKNGAIVRNDLAGSFGDDGYWDRFHDVTYGITCWNAVGAWASATLVEFRFFYTAGGPNHGGAKFGDWNSMNTCVANIKERGYQNANDHNNCRRDATGGRTRDGINGGPPSFDNPNRCACHHNQGDYAYW